MLLKCVSCLDLTALSGDDTPEVIQKLCKKAAEPLKPETLKRWNISEDSEIELFFYSVSCPLP